MSYSQALVHPEPCFCGLEPVCRRESELQVVGRGRRAGDGRALNERGPGLLLL